MRRATYVLAILIAVFGAVSTVYGNPAVTLTPRGEQTYLHYLYISATSATSTPSLSPALLHPS